MTRYVTLARSESGHCCFSASVLDTTRPASEQAVAECFSAEDAQNIADALNDAREAGRGVLQVLLAVVKAAPGQQLTLSREVLEDLRLDDTLTTVLQPDGGLHLKIG